MTDLTAKDLMTPDVLAVRANWPVQKLASFFTDHEISGAPVLSAHDALVGVVSLSDIARHASTMELPDLEDQPSGFYLGGTERLVFPKDALDALTTHVETTVADIMMPATFSVTEDAPLSEVADKMIRGHLHRLLVTKSDQTRYVVGIITTLDLLKALRKAIPTAER